MMARSRRDARRTARIDAQRARDAAIAHHAHELGFDESPFTPGLFVRHIDAS